jgi:hypothetical protein
MWNESEGDEIRFHLASVRVEPQHISVTAVALFMMRTVPRNLWPAVLTAGLLVQGITDRAAAEATLARLRAASLLELGASLDAYSSEALAEAIAFTPLRPVRRVLLFRAGGVYAGADDERGEPGGDAVRGRGYSAK